MAKRRRKQPLRGSPTEHANEAQRFFQSARNNFRRRENDPERMSCSNIEHMTDVIVEATVAAVAASHAGDRNLEANAERLMHEATVKQRALTASCRRRERALAVTGQEGNSPRPQRRN